MKNLGDILGQHRGYKKLLTDKRTLSSIQQQWTHIAGRLAMQLQPVAVHRRVLILETQNPMWKTELAFYEDQVVSKITEALPKSGIKKLKVQMGTSKKGSATKKRKSATPQDLEAKIRADVQDKIRKGWQLCSQCGSVYVEKPGMCDFCRIASQ